MKQILLIVFLFISTIFFGQKEDLIKYLDACKTAEFDESKEIIKSYTFPETDIPKISEYGSINGLMFDTDTIPIKGFKAIVNCKIENKNHQIIEQRMIAVMYFDKSKNHWSVFAFRESLDITHEYEATKASKDKFYNQPPLNLGYEYWYRSLAYWGLMAGKLKEAKTNIQLAIAEAKTNKNTNFISDSQTTDTEIILEKIMQY